MGVYVFFKYAPALEALDCILSPQALVRNITDLYMVEKKNF